MEWSKEKTLRLIGLMQANAGLWNPSIVGDTRKDKQKRREEIRNISNSLGVSLADTTKKLQHLRTQYNRELARYMAAYLEDPNEKYISNWYAFEYLHFLKYSNKPYRVINLGSTFSSQSEPDSKLSISPQQFKIRTEILNDEVKLMNRDEFTVFGEYVANELRSLKGEKNLLVAKKKIQDIIFEVKMEMIAETRPETNSNCSVYTKQPQNTSMNSLKMYTTPTLTTPAQIEPLSESHMQATAETNVLDSACHYSNFKIETSQ